MNYRFESRSTLFSGAFSETLWETLVTLGVAAAICISLIGLSARPQRGQGTSARSRSFSSALNLKGAPRRATA